jgi:hypothetical protein
MLLSPTRWKNSGSSALCMPLSGRLGGPALKTMVSRGKVLGLGT